MTIANMRIFIGPGGGGALKRQQLFSVFLLLSLSASRALLGSQAAATLGQAVPAADTPLAEYQRDAKGVAEGGDPHSQVPLRDDAPQVEQLQHQMQQMQRLLHQQQMQQMQQHRLLEQVQQQLHTNQQIGGTGAILEQDKGALAGSDHQLHQQEGQKDAAKASQPRPVLRGHLLLFLGILMLIFAVNGVKVDPAAKEMTFEEGVRLGVMNPMGTADLVHASLALLAGLLGPIFVLVGGIKLARSLPPYLRRPKEVN
ncbi:hypothetical protein Emag_005387 [Eimeria magna]